MCSLVISINACSHILSEKPGIFLFAHFYIFIERIIKEALIPEQPESGCPSGTFNSFNTCYCEDHCSWKSCRLFIPPQNCLSNIKGEVVWAWDTEIDVWVAQGNDQT